MRSFIAVASIVFSFLTSTSFAQTKTANKLGEKSKLSKTDSLMCGKEWHVSAKEESGVNVKPGERNQNDMLLMTTDMRFALILFGNKKMGTWSRAGQNITFLNDANGEKIVYKVLAVEPKKIKVDFYCEEEGHSVFEYSTQ